jgi:hypothetical protein
MWVELSQPRQAEVGRPVTFDVVASLAVPAVPVDSCDLLAAVAQVALMPALKLECRGASFGNVTRAGVALVRVDKTRASQLAQAVIASALTNASNTNRTRLGTGPRCGR